MNTFELKNQLSATGKLEGKIHTIYELIVKYGVEPFAAEAEDKVESYGLQYLFREYITDTLGIYNGDCEDMIWYPKGNRAQLMEPIDIGCNTKITGYMGCHRKLIVQLVNEQEGIDLFLEVPTNW